MKRTIITLAALLAFGPTQPLNAQGFAPPPDPTIADTDPGVDGGSSEDALPTEYRRQPVYYRTAEPPGTIIINTADRFLYLIQGNNVAIRYGVGVGRDGFQWGGTQKITRKAEWPDWTPPPEMIQRQPYLPRFMAGGPGNPMGARDVSRRHGLSHPRHQCPADHRPRRVLRLLPAGERRDRRSLRARAGRHPRYRPASIERDCTQRVQAANSSCGGQAVFIVRCGAVVLTLGLTGCASSQSPSWHVDQSTDRVTGLSSPSGAYINTHRSVMAGRMMPRHAMLQIVCFGGQPTINIVPGFGLPANINAAVAYRFDDKPGHEVETRFLSGRRNLAIEYTPDVKTFVDELRQSKKLAMRIRSLNHPMITMDFDVEGAENAVDRALESCRSKFDIPAPAGKKKVGA